ILPEVSADELGRLSRQASVVERDPAARAYVEAVRSLPFIDQTLTGTLPLEWAPVRMVSDDPIKGVGKAPRGALLAAALDRKSAVEGTRVSVRVTLGGRR